MKDLGPPIAYLVLKTGTPVYDRNGDRVGVVEHVVADEAVDIFLGLVIHTEPLPGRHVYADADQIAELRERGALLSVGRDELPQPAAPSPPRRADDEPIESPLHAGLRRAWDWISRLPSGH
jgi:hypothetical protein